MMSVVVVSASELTKEGQVHDSSHVGRRHCCGDHAHNKHDCVGAICMAFAFEESPAASTSQNLVLGPEASERRKACERNRADQESLVSGRHELAHATHVLLHIKAVHGVADRAGAQE